MLMKNYFIFLIIWILLVLESHAQLRWIGKVCFFFREKINIYENRFSRILQASYFYARSERSAQLLAFKRENFAYSRTKISHFSMCPFRGCGFTYGKKNITSPWIRFELLWDCGDNESKYSGDNLIGLFCLLNYRYFSVAFKGHLFLGLFSPFCWQT